jgi:D-aspartate ligase
VARPEPVQSALVVEPAIKPRFVVHATGAKTWRADSKEQLAKRFAAATAATGGDPIMVQELTLGFGDRQFAYCAVVKDGRAAAGMVVRRTRQHPARVGRASTYVEGRSCQANLGINVGDADAMAVSRRAVGP